MDSTAAPADTAPTGGGLRSAPGRRGGRLGIQAKVFGVALVAVGVAALIGLIAIARLQQLDGRVEDVKRHGLVPVSQLAEVRRAVLQTRIDALAEALLGSDVEHAAYLADIQAVDAGFQAYVSGNEHTGDDAALIADFRAAWQEYVTVWPPGS
jgi:methyl-accepting chemotaxis protein